MDITVIMCTRNPRPEFARRVLDSLRAQTLPKEQWELLIVDNASQKRLADEWNLSWHPRSRHVREDVIGVTAARMRGISESSGELLVFVDDDTVMDSDYLTHVLAIAARRADLGVFGAGTLEPEYERRPSQALVARVNMLGVRTVAAERSSHDPSDYTCRPSGAGMCVEREVGQAFQALVERLHVKDVIGRKGDRLFSGEDDLFSWAAAANGKAFGVFPELRLTHLISANRTRLEYLIRLEHDHAFSHVVLNYVLNGQKAPRRGLSTYVRLIGHGLRNGLPSLRCYWARCQGESHALRHIEDRRLEVLPEPFSRLSRIVVRVIQVSCLVIVESWLH